uniref:Inactive TPR repeat-containing thioredoxin TTL3-like n=1 Tax=Ananas comosus var. bracteatus TaxID=296719 RepID=A0A6V7P6D7_ANACO|nr:unnamed protein product [Ananas comosus var. bracteatus]
MEERRPPGCTVLFRGGIFRRWNRHRRTASTPPAIVPDTNPQPPRGSTRPKRTAGLPLAPVAKSTSVPAKRPADPVDNPRRPPYRTQMQRCGYCRSSTPHAPNRNVLDVLPKTAKELRMDSVTKKQPKSNGSMANEDAKKKSNTLEEAAEEPRGELCRALSRRLGPEELKAMGSQECQKGRLAEALALYERAIVMDPNKASYRCSKAVALAGLGRLLDAVAECREAIRINPSYYKAHHRLGTLYLRLGEADRAIHHYKQSRREAGAEDISQAQAIKTNIAMCYEARKMKDWIAVLKESHSAAFKGADYSPQVFALQAEALLKLQRHDEADTVLNSAPPKFDLEASTQLFGTTRTAYVQLSEHKLTWLREAVAVAQRAADLDPGNREIYTVVRRTKAVASARSKGNELFKACKFVEACKAYEEGLNQESHNAVLLCNRAACRSKLGQYEKAIEDCNGALAMRPSYSKARLRRADCNAKLERWEASIRDYQVLVREIPGNEEVSKALAEAEAQLKKKQNEEEKDTSRP